MIQTIIQNWKTSVIGVIAIIVTVGFVLGKVPENDFLVVFGALTAGGLLVAKDAK